MWKNASEEASFHLRKPSITSNLQKSCLLKNRKINSRIVSGGIKLQSPDREESIYLNFLLSDGRGTVILSGRILFLRPDYFVRPSFFISASG